VFGLFMRRRCSNSL